MWSKTYTTTTREVTKEQIWQLYSDIDNWKSWDPSVEYSKLLGDFKVGEYFHLKPKGGPKMKIKLIEVVPYKKFTDLTRFPLARMYGEHFYEETEDGLKITIKMSVKGLLAKLWVKLVAKEIANNLPNDVIKQINTAKKL